MRAGKIWIINMKTKMPKNQQKSSQSWVFPF